MVEKCILDEDGVAEWDGLGARGQSLDERRTVWKEVCL